MVLKTRAMISAVVGGLLLAAGTLVMAETTATPKPEKKWAQNHPRQHEVLKRTRNERKRINADYKAGKITKQQRDQLLAQTKEVRQEDRADSKANGGSITKDQQKDMNQQENTLNKEIGSDVKQDAGSTTPK